MRTCPKCNKEVSDDTKFCSNCGSQIFETIFCPNCGEQTSTEFDFCQSCGATTVEEAKEISTEASKEKQIDTKNVVAKTKKISPKKAGVFACIGGCVVAIVILICMFNGGTKTRDHYTNYIKDKEIFIADLKEDAKNWQLTSKLVDTDSDDDELDNESLNIFSSGLERLTYISEDGKYIFFPDKIDGQNAEYGLYYRELNKEEKESIKIDSNVGTYSVNTANTIMTYLKQDGDDDADLYQYKIQEDSKDKVASGVSGYTVSEDGSKVIYITSDQDLYLKYTDKEKVKIASEVTSVKYVNDALDMFYYIKDDCLYKHAEGEDRVKIASDIYEVVNIYDSGEIYYVKCKTENIPLIDYVEDDLKETDEAIVEPEYPVISDEPEYPSSWDYDTYDEWEVVYDKYLVEYEAWQEKSDRIWDEYYEANERYNQKAENDNLRQVLQEEMFEHDKYSMYYFNGTEELIVTDNLVNNEYSNYTTASNAPVVAYEAYEDSDIKKVKLSEIESAYDFKWDVESVLGSSQNQYIAIKDKVAVVEAEEYIDHFEINAKGTDIYYIDNVPQDQLHGELYHITIKDGTLSKPELYDSDVYISNFGFIDDSKIKYFKDFKDEKGELYIDKVKIDYDVNVYRVDYHRNMDKIFYFMDWDDDKEYGTLKVYEQGKAVKIADDTHSYEVMPNGKVLYLYDYSLSNCKGELYEWDGTKARRIDYDVVAIIKNNSMGGGGFENVY